MTIVMAAVMATAAAALKKTLSSIAFGSTSTTAHTDM